MRRGLAADGPASTRSTGDFERITIPNSDCDALRDLLVAEKVNTVIEIGLAYGNSALAIVEGLVIVGSDHARHVIIDAYQDRFYRSGWSVISEAGLAGLCLLIEERSQTVLPSRRCGQELAALTRRLDRLGNQLPNEVAAALAVDPAGGVRR